LFSDKIEKFIVPKKGSSHILTIIRELIDFKPKSKGTDIGGALKYFTSVIKKRSTAFLISDFIDRDFENALKIANKKHDVVALRIFDDRENEIPEIGIVPMKDNESGKISWVNTSDKDFQTSYKAKALAHEKFLRETVAKCGVDFAHINTAHSFVRPLMNLFKMRESKR
jgi:uncharacterized protein (DUF58 family)